MEVDRLAVELELALVGAVEAGEDVRERALAGAVLAEQGVDLADERLEVDAVVREHAREALRDAAHRHGRLPQAGAACGMDGSVELMAAAWRTVVGAGHAGTHHRAVHQPFGLPSIPLTSQSTERI